MAIQHLSSQLLNPNLTGMSWLLNSTGICVVSVTQFCVALQLHKGGMPVQLVVFCRCTRGGGAGLLCTLYIEWPPVHKDCEVGGNYFFIKTNNKSFVIDDRK